MSQCKHRSHVFGTCQYVDDSWCDKLRAYPTKTVVISTEKTNKSLSEWEKYIFLEHSLVFIDFDLNNVFIYMLFLIKEFKRTERLKLIIFKTVKYHQI